MERRQVINVFYIFLICLIVSMVKAVPAAKKKVETGSTKSVKMPVAETPPMGVPEKANAAEKKRAEANRKVLLGFICFMEFGVNNNLFRAMSSSDKNQDGNLSIEEFFAYYKTNPELRAVVSKTKEDLFQMFDRNKDGLINTQDTLTSSACDRAKEEKKEVLPSYMEDTFENNIDAAMITKNAGEFDKVMKPIRKYVLSLYDTMMDGKVTPDVINVAVWGACRDIKMGGIVKCRVLKLDDEKQMVIIRQWIEKMVRWSRTHPMV